MWARAHRRVTTADVDGHIHACWGAANQPKTRQRYQDRRLRELQDARDQTVRDYQAALARGEVRPLYDSYEDRLRDLATGTGEQAEAAQRLLAKREKRRAEKDSSEEATPSRLSSGGDE